MTRFLFSGYTLALLLDSGKPTGIETSFNSYPFACIQPDGRLEDSNLLLLIPSYCLTVRFGRCVNFA
jgi:hypothetical protein